MTYNESACKLHDLRRSNDAMFRMAISHLMDVGIRHLTPENIESSCKSIMQEDDTNHFMTNEFKCELIRMAGEIAKIDHIHLLVYISRQMYYGVDDNRIEYERAIEMVQDCIDWITEGADEEDAYNDLTSGIGFSSDELEELGYENLILEDIPQDKIFMAVLDDDYYLEHNEYPEEYHSRYAKEIYEFDTPQEFIKKWYEIEEGAWYWVFDEGMEICSGAVDPNDIELFEDHFDMVFEEE